MSAHPPRPPSTDEVVAWLLGSEVGSCVDTTGRPLAEQASPLYASVPRREERRIFGDARDATGLPCNVAALEQVQGVWPALSSALSGLDADLPDTMARTFHRVVAGVRLGPLLASRRGQPVPVTAGALYKLMLGFGELCAALLLEEGVDADDPTPSVEWLDAVIDARPWLIGTSQVCAGSRAQIRRTWRALSASGPADAADEPLDALVSPWFRDALGALLELEALAASSAGAARVALLHRRPSAPLGRLLFGAAQVPLWAESLRQVEGAGPAHPSLLFASQAVPASLRAFVADTDRTTGRDLDAALLAAAQDPAMRLRTALSLGEGAPLGETAFARACSA